MSFAYQICSSSWGCDDIYCFNDHKTGAQVNLGSATAFNCIFFIHVSSDTSNVFLQNANTVALNIGQNGALNGHV